MDLRERAKKLIGDMPTMTARKYVDESCALMADLLEKIDSLSETAQLFRNTAEDYAEKIGKLRKDLDFERGTSNFDATRLRRLATLVGRSCPDSDETLLACAGTVIGGIALSVEKLFKDHKIALEGLHTLMVERDRYKAVAERLSAENDELAAEVRG